MGYLPLPYNKDRNKVFYKEMDNGLIVCVGIRVFFFVSRQKKNCFILYSIVIYMGDVFTYIIATGLLLTNR